MAICFFTHAPEIPIHAFVDRGFAMIDTMMTQVYDADTP